ncbi:MAG: hypothetical protein PHX05_02770 [Acidobacteriota bacterium]|jgi:hypothetical protein|nr:hypothetical protein [Acidobacteriota bacterium]
MKKIMIRVLLALLVLVVAYLAFNQVDARPIRSSLGEPPAPAADAFNKANGFYRLWTLTEPRDVDIETDAAILPYRRLFDPAFDNDRYIREFNQTWATHKKNYHASKELAPVFAALRFGGNWSSALNQYREQLTKAREEYGFMLARYEKLIDSDMFSDFSLVRADTPIPNLLAWLHTAKLSIALDIMAAQNGNAPEAAAHLLRHLRFAAKASANSRLLIANLVAKAVARLSIGALNDIMNQKDCPPQVFQLVYEQTNRPLASDEFGSRLSLLCEMSLPSDLDFSKESWYSRMKYKFLYQKNRTRNARIRFMEGVIRREQTPPFQWRDEPLAWKPLRTGIFWRLQNPVGKILLDVANSTNFIGVIYKSYQLKTFYDMAHIAADLHRGYDPARTIQAQLSDLPSYRELLDPCSGKPYVWNEAKQKLYSIGIDRRDNQGETKDYQDWQDSDYALPVILYVK